jgi:hypothetical protein
MHQRRHHARAEQPQRAHPYDRAQHQLPLEDPHSVQDERCPQQGQDIGVLSARQDTAQGRQVQAVGQERQHPQGKDEPYDAVPVPHHACLTLSHAVPPLPLAGRIVASGRTSCINAGGCDSWEAPLPRNERAQFFTIP